MRLQTQEGDSISIGVLLGEMDGSPWLIEPPVKGRLYMSIYVPLVIYGLIWKGSDRGNWTR